MTARKTTHVVGASLIISAIGSCMVSVDFGWKIGIGLFLICLGVTLFGMRKIVA